MPAVTSARSVFVGALCWVLFAVQPAAGRPLSVQAGSRPGQVVIEATDGSIDEILAQLGQSHDFKTERLAGSESPRMWSGRYQGSLEDALANILAGENYLVEHSRGAKFGIANVKMFGASAPLEDTQKQSAPRPVAFVPTPATGRPATIQPSPRDARPQPAIATGQPKQVAPLVVPITPSQLPVRRRGTPAQ